MKFTPVTYTLQNIFLLQRKYFLCLKYMIAAIFLGNLANAQVNIYFYVQNEQVVGTNYEFDVYMNADQTNTFHSRGHVYLLYNQAAFGNNVVLNGNCTYNHLSLLNGIAMSGPVPIGAKYSTINFVDNGPRIVLTWLSNFLFAPPSSAAHNEVPMTPTPLYHVSIAIQDGTKAPNIQLDLGLMDRQIFYFNSATLGAEIQYSFGQLPASLSAFEAKAIGDKEALIQWATLDETNTSHFILEKKVGNGDFAELARIDAHSHGKAGSDYAFTDASFMGENNYYRLKSVNLNGDVVFSDAIEVNFHFSTADLIISYPNPTTDFLHLKSTALLEDDYYFQLNDISGNVLQRKMLNKGDLDLLIDLRDYPAGVFLLKIEGPYGLQSIRRIVKN